MGRTRTSLEIIGQDKTGAAFASVNRGLRSLNNRVISGTRAFERYAVVAGVAAAAFSIREAAAFEKKMKEVSTLLDDTSGMDVMTEAVRQLSIQFGEIPVAQAQATYNIISAGATSTAEAMQLLQASNKLALGGVTDVATAADGLTSVLDAYGASGLTATDISDKLFAAMRAGKTTIGKMAAGIGSVSGLASEAGVSLDDLLAAMATVTKGGQKTSVVFQGLRQVIANVLQPSSAAAKLAEDLELKFNAEALAAKGLAGFLKDVADKTGGSTEKMAKLFGSVEALVPVMVLAGTRADVFAKTLKDVRDSAGETDKAVKKMETSGDLALRRLKGLGIEAADTFGRQLLPGIADVANMLVGPGVDSISAMDSAFFDMKVSVLDSLGQLALGLKAIISLQGRIKTLSESNDFGAYELAAKTLRSLLQTIPIFGRAVDESLFGDATIAQLNEGRQTLDDFSTAMAEGSEKTRRAKAAAITHAKAVKDEVASILSGNAALRGRAKALAAVVKSANAAAVSTKKLDDANKKLAQGIVRSLATAEERHIAALQKIADLGPEAFGGMKEYEQAIRRTEAAYEKLNKITEASTRLARDFGDAFSSSFEEAIIGGNKFSDVLKGLAQDVLRLFVRETVSRPLATGLTSIFSGINFGALFGFAEGGRPPVGVPSIVGERGPELFVPDRSGTIVPNNRMGGDGPVTIINHIDARGATMDVAPIIEVAASRGAHQGYALALEDARTRGPLAMALA